MSDNPADNPPNYDEDTALVAPVADDTSTKTKTTTVTSTYTPKFPPPPEPEVEPEEEDYAAPRPRRHRGDGPPEFDWSMVRTTTESPISEEWFTKNWRPMMAWLYMVMIAFDFIVAPIISMVLPVMVRFKDIAYTTWHPISLEGGGLIHITFGVVLGITAWGRTQEKTRGGSSGVGG